TAKIAKEGAKDAKKTGQRGNPASAIRKLRLYQLFGGGGARADTVGDADAAVGVARQDEAGELLAQALDAVEAIEVSNAVLGHGGLPFVDAGEDRLGAQAENLLQLGAHDSDDLVVGEWPDIFGISSSKKTTQQGAIVGRAVRELVVDESCGQKALAFAAGN